MPYHGSSRLPAEFASKTSHMDVIENEFIKKLISTFESTNKEDIEINAQWENYTIDKPLPLVFSVDGSFQIVRADSWPYKKIAFVKIALVILDNDEILELDKENPHPMKIRDILARSSFHHSTVIPLQHVKQKGMTNYETIRNVIFNGMKDKNLDGEVLETLKWLAYEKWDGKKKDIPLFGCPHCRKTVATLSYDKETGNCGGCGGDLFITDMLGFHQDTANEDTANEVIVNSYMSVYETLLLFTGIRYFWENNKEVFDRAMFLKDGPLSIRAQYSKLVEPIRRFLSFANKENNPVYLVGQEKSGAFADHLEFITMDAPEKSIFVPDDNYIKEDVQQRPLGGQDYGFDTNYGSKAFVKISDRHSMVLNIPTGLFKANPKYKDLIGINTILGTLNLLLSSRHESGLIPIEMAHNIASLSTYPSAKLLKILAKEAGLI